VLRCSNPCPTELWLAIPCGNDHRAAYRLEAALHKRFATWRHRGEWFALCKEIIAYIRTARRDLRKPEAAA
jgi:hypothetical protein